MSTLMSVTVFMNFSKSRSDMSRAAGVSAATGAGLGLLLGFRLLLELRQHVQVSVVLFADMDICSPFAALVRCSFGSC